MIRPAAVSFLLVALCACKPAEESHSKAILGAVLFDGNGGPPLTNSVVVVSGDRIQAAGARSTIPIPAGADQIDGGGKFVVPQVVDLCDRADPAGMLRPRDTEEARSKVAELTAARVSAIHLGAGTPEGTEAVIEAARTGGTPVFAHVSTAAEVTRLVDAGISVFIGMIRDTEGLDPEFLSRLRTLRIVFAPALGGAGASVDVAKRNTLRLFQAGVPIALATEGRPIQQELELLASAGIPPIDIIVTASRNGATALRTTDRGIVEAGRRADLLLLSANPAEEIANYRRVVLRMSGGAWVK